MTANSVPVNSRTSKPSSFGIGTSRKRRSGLSSPTAFTASKPLAHSAAISISGCARKSSRNICRANSSSSTITARIFFCASALKLRHLSFRRKRQRHAKSVAIASHIHRSPPAKSRSQPPAHILKPQSIAPLFRRFGIPLVLHHDQKTFSLGLNNEPHPTAIHKIRNSMHHGVFHQRLQKQRRDKTIERFRIHLLLHIQPRAEANFFHAQERSHQRHLLLERDQIFFTQAQRAPKKIAEQNAHLARLRRIGTGERADRVQAGENKMRIPLRLQRPQLRITGKHARFQHPLLGLP